MEWALPAGLIALLVLACPLMMVGMMAFGWLFMRGRSGSGNSGHGMMMCMGHGQHDADGRHQQASEPAEPLPVEELKAERGRLDELITRTEASSD
jgi:hypothetical protein